MDMLLASDSAAPTPPPPSATTTTIDVNNQLQHKSTNANTNADAEIGRHTTSLLLQPLDEIHDFETKKLSLPIAGTTSSANICQGCGCQIHDQFVLHSNDQYWHEECLRCAACGLQLEQCQSCYVKEDQAYCKGCYARQFGVKCARCGRQIQPRDWVRRARQLVYHLACFACDACKRQLSTGEHFALQECRVLCKQHYMELIDGDAAKGSSKAKCKRVRTTFTEDQLQVLQANFQIDSNPDGQDLERIAQITGLSKRVTQVWFQNSRARQKKYQTLKHRQPSNSPGGGPPIVSSVLTEPEPMCGAGGELLGQERSLTASVYSTGDDHLSSLDMSPDAADTGEMLHQFTGHFEHEGSMELQ